MPQDLFDIIEKAESDAKVQIASAQKEAREIIKASSEACAQDVKEQEKHLQAAYQEEMKKRKANIQHMLDDKMAERKKANEQSLKQAESAVTKAAHYIAQKVMQNGHS